MPGWSEEEKLRRISEGLPLQFPPPALNEGPAERAARTIRAEWFDPAKPLVAVHAIIVGPVRMASALLEGEWSLTDSVFHDAADFTAASFRSAARFDYSHFLRPVSFRDARVAGALELRHAFFGARADFTGLSVTQALDARGVTLAEAAFDNAQIGDALFEPAGPGVPSCFTGPVSFVSATIGGLAMFSSAQFLDAVRFDGCRFERGVFFRPSAQAALQVQFRGPASFAGAAVTGDADFRAAVFRADANFERWDVHGDANFGPDDAGRRVVFLQDARFPGARVAGRAVFRQADFFARADFRDAVFAAASFDHAGFRRPADFQGAQFSLPAAQG